MSKKFMYTLLAIVVTFAVIMIGIQYVVQRNTREGPVVQEGRPFSIKDESYVSETGGMMAPIEASVRFFNTEVILTIIHGKDGKEYRDVSLQKVGSSLESKYENKDLGFVLWEKPPGIVVYKDGELLFSGKSLSDVIVDNLTSYKWIWEKTYDGAGPDAELDKNLFPKKPGAFSIIFTKDGKINGTTDCNNFTGTYTSVGDIKPTVSTEKLCKGSQESEFLKMITGGSIGLGEKDLYIERDQTLIFSRGEKIK